MEYKLNKLPNSAYEISFVFTKDETKALAQETTQRLEANKIPIDHPEYLTLYKMLYPEHLCVQGMKEMMSRDEAINQIKFIGEFYAVDTKTLANEGESVTFLIDVYPEGKFVNDRWLKLRPQKIDEADMDNQKELITEYLELYLKEVLEQSYRITIPNTLIEKDLSSRLEMLKNVLSKEEYSQASQDDDFIAVLHKNSEESLSKHFAFLSICEYFSIDWKNKDLSHEQLLYDKLCAMN